MGFLESLSNESTSASLSNNILHSLRGATASSGSVAVPHELIISLGGLLLLAPFVYCYREQISSCVSSMFGGGSTSYAEAFIDNPQPCQR